MNFATGATMIALVVSASAQPVPASRATPTQNAPAAANPSAAGLGRGWTALAAGRHADALAAARQILRRDPADHDALSLAVAALTAGRQSLASLDLYEQWLGASAHEDLFPLKAIAKSFLLDLSESPEPRIRIAALLARAEAGEPGAHDMLEQEARSGAVPLELDAALAAAGEAPATGRLEALITAGGSRDKSAAIEALAAAGPAGASAAIAKALNDPAPPSRIAAASALADLGAVDAVPALKAALADSNPAVRFMVRVALARLGDPEGGTALQELTASPVSEFRLLAARLAAAKDPRGNWSATVLPMLQDDDPLVRLHAANLLFQYGRAAEAQPAVDAALSDRAPFVRTQAARLFRERMTALDPNLPKIRQMLRDRLPEVQIEAAKALLSQPSKRAIPAR
jgi:HEAT repeat protein